MADPKWGCRKLVRPPGQSCATAECIALPHVTFSRSPTIRPEQPLAEARAFSGMNRVRLVVTNMPRLGLRRSDAAGGVQPENGSCLNLPSSKRSMTPSRTSVSWSTAKPARRLNASHMRLPAASGSAGLFPPGGVAELSCIPQSSEPCCDRRSSKPRYSTLRLPAAT
jgi:hypothetical protein